LDLLSPEMLKRLAAIDSPTVSNAIESFKVRNATDGYASMELSCQYRDMPPMVGYAVTCTADSTSATSGRVNRRYELLEAIQAAPKPAIVVIKNVGPNRLRSCHAGDVLSSMFQELGAIGLVTDGGVRDLSGIRKRAPGFQVFSAGVVVSHGIPLFVEVGVTVEICGLTVRPGDLLHGDENGLLAIPMEIAAQVPTAADEVVRREEGTIGYVRGQEFTIEGLRKRG
jgi:4-hydroxy-4-methyl-2-oxoglutarate aldolase